MHRRDDDVIAIAFKQLAVIAPIFKQILIGVQHGLGFAAIFPNVNGLDAHLHAFI